MELFNLKQLREKSGLNQTDFGKSIGYKQSIISKIEKGDHKKISDKLLMAIEEVYKVNLDVYKKYEKNKKEAVVSNGLNTVDEHAHLHEANEHVQKYDQLLAEKAKLDERFFASNKEHETANSELELLRENNRLLKEIVANTYELLSRTMPKVK